jgi:hypothetical protein
MVQVQTEVFKAALTNCKLPTEDMEILWLCEIFVAMQGCLQFSELFHESEVQKFHCARRHSLSFCSFIMSDGEDKKPEVTVDGKINLRVRSQVSCTRDRALISVLKRDAKCLLTAPRDFQASHAYFEFWGCIFLPAPQWFVSSTTLMVDALRVQNGEQVTFQAKPTTKLSKLMKAYCDRQGVDYASVVFSYDGQRIREDQTPGEVRPLLFSAW